MSKIPSPVDVASDLSPVFDAACNLVATALRRGETTTTIATHLIDRRLLGQVIAEIESAGWSVTVVPDQRDGDYLSIEAAL